MSQEVTIVTPENVELRFELAGVGSRFSAMFMDTLYQALIVILGIFAYFLLDSAGKGSDWLEALGALVMFALIEGYFLYFEVAQNGQTPGKRMAGIRVIRDTGQPIDFRSGFLRNIMRVVDALPAVYFVGFISMLASNEYRRLGDYVAGTLVVKVDVSEPKQATAVADELAQAPPLPDEAMGRLSLVTKDDYRAVTVFLGRCPELKPELVDQLAANIATPLAWKLQLDLGAHGLTNIQFLRSLRREWERRMTR